MTSSMKPQTMTCNQGCHRDWSRIRIQALEAARMQDDPLLEALFTDTVLAGECVGDEPTVLCRDPARAPHRHMVVIAAAPSLVSVIDDEAVTQRAADMLEEIAGSPGPAFFSFTLIDDLRPWEEARAHCGLPPLVSEATAQRLRAAGRIN